MLDDDVTAALRAITTLADVAAFKSSEKFLAFGDADVLFLPQRECAHRRSGITPAVLAMTVTHPPEDRRSSRSLPLHSNIAPLCVELPGKLFGLHELRARGHKMKSIGREQIDGVNYYVLQLILNDGDAISLYVDPNSWLVTRRRDVRPLHVDVDPRPTTIEQVSSDFHDVDGVKFPFATAETDLNTGKLLESTITKSVKINPTLPPTLFDKL